jgi:phosphotransacetylase
MPLASFDQLFRFADALTEPVGVAVAGGADPTVLEALRTACDRGWVRPFLVGKGAEIRHKADACGIGLQGFTIIDLMEPATAAVALVRNRQAGLLMKGQIATPALMKAVLDPASGLRTGRVICQIVLMEIAERRFLLADTGICIQPTLEQKIDIMMSAVEMAHALQMACPRVGVMAATESVTDSMPETLDAADMQRRGQAGEFPGCTVRGPLSFDLAYDEAAGVKKKLTDPAHAVADIMLFPNLLSANLTVKAIMYTADCRYGGILCGTVCPVVFMSRADTAETRLHSLALALKSNGHLLAFPQKPAGNAGQA